MATGTGKRLEKRHGRLRWDDVLPIIHDSRQLLVVEKPAGLDTSRLPESSVDGVVEILRAFLGEEELLPVNRLARYESGLLMLARDAETARALRGVWRSGRVRQEYHAVVMGRVGRGAISITERHGSSKGRSRRREVRSKQGGARNAAVSTPQGSTPERVNTTIQGLFAGERRSLVVCRTTAPTTHALRAQLRSAGHRLVGDPLHEPRHARRLVTGTCLHLVRVGFPRGALPDGARLQCLPPDYSAAVRGERDFTRPLVAALARRLPLLRSETTDAYRLLSGEQEEMPGLIVERFGAEAFIFTDGKTSGAADRLRETARWYREALGLRAVYAKTSASTAGASGAEPADSALLLAGRDLVGDLLATEHGLRFLVRPDQSYSVGLFPDQRDNRKAVRDFSAGRDVLNLFAYTCGFSVAAAVGGARSVVSVDLSSKALEWGKENLRANGLDPGAFAFERSSASDFLKRSMKQNRTFDLIILDAPTFAHGRNRKQSFSISRDLSGLVAQSSEVLRPGGILLVSMNFRRMSWRGLRERIRRGLAGRRYRELASPPLPVDYAVDPDHAKWIWIQVD